MICDSSFRKKVFLKLVCNFAMICDTPWVGQKRVICPALHKGPFHSRRIRPTIFDPWREVQPSGGGDLPVEIWEGCICRRKLLCGLFSLWKLIRPWLGCRSENCPLPLHQLPLSSPDTARVAFLKKFSRNFPNNSIGRQPILQLINLRSRNSGRGGSDFFSFSIKTSQQGLNRINVANLNGKTLRWHRIRVHLGKRKSSEEWNPNRIWVVVTATHNLHTSKLASLSINQSMDIYSSNQVWFSKE